MGTEGVTYTTGGIWPLLFQWLAEHPLWVALLVGVPAAVFLLVRFWDRLLEWEGGRAWPVPAAIAPPFIAIVRGWDPTGPFGPIGPTMTAVLLACIAFLQIYGQARNNRERIKTEDRITEQTNILTEQTNLLVEQRSLSNSVAIAVNAIAIEISKQKDEDSKNGS